MKENLENKSISKSNILKEILENLSEEKLSDIKVKHDVFPKGTFSEDNSPEEIAKIVCSKSKDYKQAVERVVYFYNRAGKNLKDRHKEIIKELEKICK